MRKYRAMALSAVALGVLLSGGCGPATTNDENVAAGGAPKDAGTIPSPKDYGEAINRQREKEAQAKQAQKEAKGTTDSKAPPKGP
jgi:hypothetical protein